MPTRERLRDLTLHASSPEVAFLYGRLPGQEEVRSAQSREHFAAAWRAAGLTFLHRRLR